MYTTQTHLLLIYSFAHYLSEDGLYTAGALQNKYLWLQVQLIGLYSTVNTSAIRWIIYCTVNTLKYIIHQFARTNLQCGNTTSAGYFRLQTYATYIRVIFCRVQQTNRTPLSGSSLVVGLITITNEPCTMWCGDIHTHNVRD